MSVICSFCPEWSKECLFSLRSRDGFVCMCVNSRRNPDLWMERKREIKVKEKKKELSYSKYSYQMLFLSGFFWSCDVCFSWSWSKFPMPSNSSRPRFLLRKLAEEHAVYKDPLSRIHINIWIIVTLLWSWNRLDLIYWINDVTRRPSELWI